MSSATRAIDISLMALADKLSLPSSAVEVMNKERMKYLIESHAPRPVASCSGTRYPDPKLIRDRSESRLSSERGEGKFNGNERPCAVESDSNVS